MSSIDESIEYLPSKTRFNTSSTTLCWIILSISNISIKSMESLLSMGFRTGSLISLNKWSIFYCSFKYFSRLVYIYSITSLHFLSREYIFFCLILVHILITWIDCLTGLKLFIIGWRVGSYLKTWSKTVSNSSKWDTFRLINRWRTKYNLYSKFQFGCSFIWLIIANIISSVNFSS